MTACDGALVATALRGMPYVTAGADLVELISSALARGALALASGDVLVVTSKVVARAEGRTVSLASVTPSREAVAVAAETGGDPRVTEVILGESTAISRKGPGLLLVRHRLGFVCANAGVDRSNIEDGSVLLLPRDPDASAEQLRAGLSARFAGAAIGVVISDTQGRAFRLGTVGVAIGVAGIPALYDQRGRPDLHGRALEHTVTALGDQIAAVADLVGGQADEGLPVVHLRGLQLPPARGMAADLVRPAAQDVYA